MMHSRRWCVGPVQDAAELGRKLTETTWALCAGFELGEYVFLNDSTSEDGAQEYAVVKRLSATRWVQIESITFGWCTLEKALDYVRAALDGRMDQSDFCKEVSPRIDAVADHGSCRFCA